MKYKKAQAWGFDVMIATVIFLFGIIIFFLYSVNYPKSQNEKIENLFFEANMVSDDLLSKGNPENWNINSITKIGIVDNGKINQTKLDMFYTMSQTQYEKTKSLFGTKYNYFINASESLQNSSGTTLFGIGLNPVNPVNNIKVSRITSYKNKPITIEVSVWE